MGGRVPAERVEVAPSSSKPGPTGPGAGAEGPGRIGGPPTAIGSAAAGPDGSRALGVMAIAETLGRTQASGGGGGGITVKSRASSPTSPALDQPSWPAVQT